MLEIPLKNNLALLCSQDIKEICRPFFQKYQLNHLNYIRIYKDRSVFYLCSNHDWLKHYFTHAYPTIGAFEQNNDLADFRYVLWSSLDNSDPILKYTREIFSVYHGITLINKCKDYVEYYNIGSGNSDKNVINFFINNYEILQNFCSNFKEKASRLIRLSYKQKIILSSSALNLQQPANTVDDACQQFNNFTQPLLQTPSVHLTKAELICIKLYLTEKSPQEISKLLGISRRTFEKHIENIKLKFNCKKQLQLGYALAKAGIEID